VSLRHSIAGTLAVMAVLAATAAQAEDTACMTQAQLSDLVLVAAPGGLATVRQQCAGALAPDSLLRDPAGPLTLQYEAAAKEAWPRAKEAMLTVWGGKASAEKRKQLSDAMTPQFLGNILAPLMAKSLTPESCPAVDHVIALLAPLPPRNLGDLVATMVALDQAHKTQNGPLPICKS